MHNIKNFPFQYKKIFRLILFLGGGGGEGVE